MLQWTMEYIYLFKLVFLFSLSKYPQVKLLNHMAISLLTFWGISCVFHSGCTDKHLHQQCMRFLFSISPSTLCVCYLFDYSHFDRCEVMSHCGFNLHFSDNERCWASFHVFFSHLLYWFHLISFGSPLTPSSLFSSPCNSVNLSGCPSMWRNFSSFMLCV